MGSIIGWNLKFVDSRGVGDTPDDGAIKQAVDYIVEQKVDILLFVIITGERGWVHSDIEFLTRLKVAHQKKYGTELSIILVLNKIDLIEPSEEWGPPYNLSLSAVKSIKPQSQRQAKEINIVECIRARTDEYKTLTPYNVAICSSWHDYGDRRYNIEELALLVYEHIPDDAKPGFAGATAITSVKKTIVRTFTFTSALVASATCFIPLPVVDLAAMLAVQTTLVSLIARIGSSNQDKNRVAEQFIRNMPFYTGTFAIAAVASQLKFIPVVGIPMGIPAAASVAAITIAMGEAAASHFIEGLSLEETQKLFDERNKKLRDKFKDAFKKKTPEKVVKKLKEIGDEMGVTE